jgi:hypothetical protein
VPARIMPSVLPLSKMLEIKPVSRHIADETTWWYPMNVEIFPDVFIKISKDETI